MSLDFFKGVNNLNQRRTYERNDSGKDFGRGPASPSSSSRSRSIDHRQQDHHVGGHGSWTNHNPMVSIPESLPRGHAYPYHPDYRQHQVIPNEHTRSINQPTTNYNIPNSPFNQPTTNYNIPNSPFSQAPPFSYNEAPPRTSAHFHGCPSCDFPIMVQVTADLSYHHVTLIPAATARRNEMAVPKSSTESTLPSHGAQEYSPDPESIPQTHDPETSDDDSLSNDVVEVAAFQKQPERVTAPKEEVQPFLSVETKGRRSYASITAGNDKPSEQEAGNNKLLLEEEANEDKPEEEEEADEDKPEEEEEEVKDNNKTTSQVEEAADINGFTTVVSSKSKKKAKAEAKAAAFMEFKKMFNKHRRWQQRDEHNRQHHRNDRGARREHNERVVGGHDKHHGSVAKDIIGHDTHRGAPRDGRDKAPRA